jgi:hypothetical protein
MNALVLKRTPANPAFLLSPRWMQDQGQYLIVISRIALL